jgi:hypothetical protein
MRITMSWGRGDGEVVDARASQRLDHGPGEAEPDNDAERRAEQGDDR